MGKRKRACNKDLGQGQALFFFCRGYAKRRNDYCYSFFAIIAVICTAHRLTEHLAQQNITK